MNNSMILSVFIIIILLINQDKYVNEKAVSLKKSLTLPLLFLILFIETLAAYSFTNILMSLGTFLVSGTILTLAFFKINSNLYYKKNNQVYRRKNYTLIAVLITSLVIKLIASYLIKDPNLELIIKSLAFGLSFSRLTSDVILIILTSRKSN